MQFAGHDHAASQEVDNYAHYTTQAAIDHALQNLQKFHLVGCLEQLDLFVEQFALRYGTRLQIANKNRNPVTKQQQQQAISDDVMAKVHELCQPNLVIYRHAVEHLLCRDEQSLRK